MRVKVARKYPDSLVIMTGDEAATLENCFRFEENTSYRQSINIPDSPSYILFILFICMFISQK
jgi:hypothetical protein